MFEKNEQEINTIVEENLEGVLSGKTSIDEVVLRYPGHEKTLRGELEAAKWLSSRRDEVKPRPGYLASSRKRVVERIKEEARGQEGKHSVLSFNWPSQGLVFRWAAALVVVLMLFSGIGGAVAYAQDAIPGQQLYGMKRASETISYNLAIGNIRKVELNIRFTDRRVRELETLAAAGDIALVEPTLREYNWEVNQAVASLQAVSGSQLTEKKILAQELSVDLTQKAERLDDLVAIVPQDLQEKLVDARDRTLHGASSAVVVLEEVNEQMGTSTPTGTMTPQVTSTATATAKPTKTKKPVIEKLSGSEEDSSTPDEEGGKKPTVTPHPTNDNRPTKQPGPAEKGKPPKDEKPSGSIKDK